MAQKQLEKYFYWIELGSRGGTLAYSTSSQEEYDYWHSGQGIQDMQKCPEWQDFSPKDPNKAFEAYVNEAGFSSEIDSYVKTPIKRCFDDLNSDLGYIYGAYQDYSWISVKELDSNDKEAHILSTVYDEELSDLIDEDLVSLRSKVININVPYACRMEIYEKGCFFSSILVLSKPISLDKFEFHAVSFSDEKSESMAYIDRIYYDGTLLESSNFRNREGTLEEGHYASLIESCSSVMSGNLNIENPLKNQALINRVKVMNGYSKVQVARACGYIKKTKNGKISADVNAFYEALLDAEGINI